MGTDLLSIRSVNAYYGDSHVLHDVSFSLRDGQVLVLLGRNGAGKTTCISTIVGFLPIESGKIDFCGNEIQNRTPEHICGLGIGLVPQGRRVFGSLSVEENLEVASKAVAVGKRWTRDDVYAVFPRLRERRRHLARDLSGGEQQMLAIGRALMTCPRVLLLDEPSEGLAPQVVHEVGNVLSELKSQVSIILVEQNLGLALKLADDVALLSTGRMVFFGTADEFRAQQDSLQSHLGVV